jgi:hypothetical protein
VSGYTLVPIDGDPTQPTQPAQPYTLVPIQGDPFNPPSTWRNTLTGVARGIGNLLDTGGQAEMTTEQTPAEVTPQPGQISQATTNYITGGQPYVPTTPLGRLYQNVLADTVSSAPLAAIGPGGWPALAAREGLNLTGNIGGELGREAMPDHPIIGGLLGNLVAGGATMGTGGLLRYGGNQAAKLIPTQGAIEREAMSQYNPMPASNDMTVQFQGAAPVVQSMPGAASNIPQTVTNSGLLGRVWEQIKDKALPGIGLAAGEATGHALGFPYLGSGLGLAAGESGRHIWNAIKQNRTDAFNQGVQQMLANPGLMAQRWQPTAPMGLLPYLTGLTAPAVISGGGGQ